jgi:hypothetical protein
MQGRENDMAKRHKDVEFAVDDASSNQRTFKSFDAAAGFALAIALSGKEHVYLDVLIWSESGAKAYAGDAGVEQYREDPDASVFERYEIKANDTGRVP